MHFIVFFGTREVGRDESRPGVGGYQQCSRCGQSAPFRPRSTRPWRHVFWVPLIPLGTPTPIVACGHCRLRLVSAT